MTKQLYWILSLLVLASIVLTACGTAPTQSDITTACAGKAAGTVVTVGTGTKATDVTCEGDTTAAKSYPDWAVAAAYSDDAPVYITIDGTQVASSAIREVTTDPNVAAPGKPEIRSGGDPTAAPSSTPIPQSDLDTVVTPGAAAACRDGEMVQSDQVDTPDAALTRLPIGEAARANAVHLAWVGEGFAGLRRAVLITPAFGPVWGVHVKEGLFSLAGRGFCGTPAEVAAWADPAEVDSLRRASADTDGSMPPSDEIGVFLLNYEDRTIVTIKSAPNGPDAAEVLAWLEVTFSEGGNHSAVPMHVGD